MTRKPGGQLATQSAAHSHVAAGQLLPDLMDAFQHGGVFVDVTLAGRKVGFAHPAVFHLEMHFTVPGKRVEYALQVGFFCPLKRGHTVDELPVYQIHGCEPKKVAIIPIDC